MTQGGLLAVGALLACDASGREQTKVKGKLGLTVGSFMKHLAQEAQPGKVRLLDIPKIMRDELGLEVLDLMTRTFASFEPAYLDDLRNRAEKAGLTITNLKMNQRGLDMSSSDEATRNHAIAEYQRTIDAAERLCCRWVRPLPGPKRPDSNLYVDSYRRLIDYAAPKGISLLVENFGWMQNDPNAVPTIMKAVGKGLAASPDTGNWTDAARYEGLAKAFPHAATCDFKAFQFEDDGRHPRYDLQRCFRIGWDAGFRGPWCFEHFNETLDGLLKGMVKLREMLLGWGAASA
jgi:sugar phosphate isomerase/epimerase